MRYVVTTLFMIICSLFITVPHAQSEKETLIPEEAIRLRILANSNEEQDQREKLHVRDAINAYLAEKLDEAEEIEEARQLVSDHLDDLEEIVARTLNHDDFTISFTKNVSFPEKTYGDYVYQAGLYEAVLVEIGAAKGDNWWCVLFPSLCFVEYEEEKSMEDENEEQEKDFHFFLLDWFKG
ncbi:MAG TPA: stage II sporulation protein R [Pseudogracilibacillus sp.]|nr:stage II sporulation protein R [Pseudogracilibacillus sp.]